MCHSCQPNKGADVSPTRDLYASPLLIGTYMTNQKIRDTLVTHLREKNTCAKFSRSVTAANRLQILHQTKNFLQRHFIATVLLTKSRIAVPRTHWILNSKAIETAEKKNFTKVKIAKISPKDPLNADAVHSTPLWLHTTPQH